MDKIYDMLIVGGGPGGYTAAMYAARAGLSVAVLEKMAPGGQMALTHEIDNYPGFFDGIDGFTLGENMKKQAQRFGAESVLTEVKEVKAQENPKQVHTPKGIFYGKTLVISTGANPRKLGLENEEALTGRGVHYCAACDGMFFRGKTVAIVGGGNSAAADALLLSRVAEKVIVIHRRDTLRATKIYHKPLLEAENVEFLWNSGVTELLHEDRLTGLRVKNLLSGQEQEISCDGVFVSIGRQPATELVQGQLELDEVGYIIADETTKTAIPGVYAVGDVRTKQLRQIVTAVADGAMAVSMAEEYLAEQ
ncbi:MAG: thioredoxin-disulfide reductase [Oscillospiraceae bacterium]|nr:thioredoxin-disulfide reductase [Oscillospiraceae bacterium]